MEKSFHGCVVSFVGDVMYWLVTNSEEHPRRVLEDLRRQDNKNALEGLKNKVEITKQIMAWNEARGIYYYIPSEKINAFLFSVAKIKFISGGNRGGKTNSCAWEVVAQCEGRHPLQRDNLEKLRKESVGSYKYYHTYYSKYVIVDLSWVKDHVEWVLDNRLWIASPPIQARCVTVDFPNGVEKFCGPEVEKWSTKSELKDVLYKNEKRRIITWNNSSFLEFMTTDQDLDAHGGVSRHLVWFDEEPKSEYWQENMMRILTVNGRMILGMTAVKGISWPKLEIWDKWENLLEERKLA